MIVSSVSPQSAVNECIATAQPAVQTSGGPRAQAPSLAQQMLSMSAAISLMLSQAQLGAEAPIHWLR
jgi:hypothetical protein